MRNFLIFLSIFVVVGLAAADVKQRLDELDRMSQCKDSSPQQTQVSPQINTISNDKYKLSDNNSQE